MKPIVSSLKFKLLMQMILYKVGLCGYQQFRFCFVLSTAVKTDEVDVKSNFLVFELFLVLALKPLIANHKTANFGAEVKKKWCPIIFCGYTMHANYI